MYDKDFMEMGQLESGAIDAYWVSESTTLADRYITPETALTTDFAAASGVNSSSFTVYLFIIKAVFIGFFFVWSDLNTRERNLLIAQGGVSA